MTTSNAATLVAQTENHPMKIPAIALLSYAVVCLTGGCAVDPAASEEAGASEAAITSWQKMLTCNGGAAVLDVDPAERRNLQFVIRDSNVVSYLTGAVPAKWRVGATFGGEIIAASRSNNGVFGPNDFHLLVNGAVFGGGNAPSVWAGYRVTREGAGIRITFTFDWYYDAGDEAGQGAGYRSRTADWYFDSCN